MKKIAIVQSSYIPWKGFFDMIAYVDEFILFDDMQFTKRDFRNRNKIKTPQGIQWLTVPVRVKGKFLQKIRDTELDGVDWKIDHWRALELNYKRAPYFQDISKWLKPLYLEQSYGSISDVNKIFINSICRFLEIDTVIKNSWDYSLVDGKTERLVDIVKQADGMEYVSGPAAKVYINQNLFDSAGIKLTWFDYAGYKEYPQLWGDFSHEVTILDLLFNCGKNSSKFMRYL